MNKRILFVIRSLTGGGAERVVSTLSNALVNRNYDIHIILYSKSNTDYYIDDKVKIHYMPNRKNNIYGKILRIFDIKKIINSIKPDVIIPFVGTILYVSYITSKQVKPKFIRTIRDSPWHEEGSVLDKIIRKHINKKCDAIMIQNEEQRLFFDKELNNKLFVVHNPISPEFIDSKKDDYSIRINNIISVGRLTYQKNHEMLINAINDLKDKYPNLKVKIYGDGPNRDKLNELVKSYNLIDRVLILKRTNDIKKELVNSDLFVMTSRYEGMPNALMEAMALGLPCISSDCKTGPKTLIANGKDGFLYNWDSLDDLKNVLVKVIDNSEEAAKIGNAARNKIINNYCDKIIVEEFKEMLERIF